MKDAYGERKCPIREIYVAGSNAGLAELLEALESKLSDIRQGAIGLGICPALFQPYYVPVFLHYAHSSPLWDVNVHPVLLYVLSMHFF